MSGSESVEIKLIRNVPGGHRFYTLDHDGDAVDLFRFSENYCNGPECFDCGRSRCHHCFPEFDMEQCPCPG